MVKHADDSEAAASVRKAQQVRLRRLRESVEPVQANAARRAGVSVHSWSRMETGLSSVDIVALARWCESYNLPADYVVTGRLDGLPDAVKRQLILAETALAAAATSGAVQGPPSQRRRGRPRRDTGEVRAVLRSVT